MLDNKHEAVQEVLDQVIAIAKPEAVFLYNCKYDLDGDLISFKLCVICEYDNKRRLLSEIFDVDCDIPFDILLYTKEQFKELRDDTAAFANRICTKGKMLYGQE
ncbi:MAG: hypothetical protein J6A26_05495 [Oscillospiraceae bacterium]|nr:hypothetical protein [Oscillospiraceae bacterium]